MQVLLILFGSLLVFRVLGFAGIGVFATWEQSARVALATMFLFTAASHFAPMKQDLVAMVPPGLPRPDLLVFITGLAEIAGAVGLLIPPSDSGPRADSFCSSWWCCPPMCVLPGAASRSGVDARRRSGFEYPCRCS